MTENIRTFKCPRNCSYNRGSLDKTRVHLDIEMSTNNTYKNPVHYSSDEFLMLNNGRKIKGKLGFDLQATGYKQQCSSLTVKLTLLEPLDNYKIRMICPLNLTCKSIELSLNNVNETGLIFQASAELEMTVYRRGFGSRGAYTDEMQIEYVDILIFTCDLPKQPQFFNAIYESKEYSDFILISQEGIEFNVHRLIVAEKSVVIKKAMNIDMVEKKTGRMFIDVRSEILKEIILFLYEGPCNFSKGRTEIYSIAHAYQINSLLEVSKDYLVDTLNVQNLKDTLKLLMIDEGKADPLITCEHFIYRHRVELKGDEELLNLLNDNLSIENLHVVYSVAIKSNSSVKNDVLEFISKFKKGVFKNEKFMSLKKEEPQDYINMLEYLVLPKE